MSDLSVLEPPNDTQLVGERDVWLLGEADVQAIGATPGSAYIFAGVAPARIAAGENAYRLLGAGWEALSSGESEFLFFVSEPQVVEITPWGIAAGISSARPSFGYNPFERLAGTGEVLVEQFRDSLEDWENLDLEDSHADTLTLDIPAALATGRSQAGLPVQDLAAMFGIKRRQFYNLLSGEDTPDIARELRIGRVTNAITQLSELADGNSRKVRTYLLARLDGDSVYDAAVADDEDRLDWALERACSAMAMGTAVHARLTPSNRATPEEAASVREFLRSTRDDTGAASG